MPSAKRFSLLPVIVASSAAAGGILGAFVAVGLVATPVTQKTGPSPSVAQETKADTKAAFVPQAKATPAAETTGSAPPSDSAADAACDRQTWPYLSRPCMEEWQRKNRAVRVISTDKLDKPTVNAIQEAPAPQLAPSAAVASTTPPPSESMPVATSEPWFNPGALATPTAPPAVAQTPAAGQDAAKPQVTASEVAKEEPAKNDAKNDVKDDAKAKKRVAAKSKRKQKPAIESDDDGSAAVASSDDNRLSDDRTERSSRQPHRVVERASRREYDVPSEDRGERRVVVIRRGGGLFENLFGMGRRGADDDND
jgi:hypothetical protein